MNGEWDNLLLIEHREDFGFKSERDGKLLQNFKLKNDLVWVTL